MVELLRSKIPIVHVDTQLISCSHRTGRHCTQIDGIEEGNVAACRCACNSREAYPGGNLELRVMFPRSQW